VIKTIDGRGYQFIAQINNLLPAPFTSKQPLFGRLRQNVLAMSVLFVALLGLLFLVSTTINNKKLLARSRG